MEDSRRAVAFLAAVVVVALGIGLPAVAATHRGETFEAVGMTFLVLVMLSPALVALTMAYIGERGPGVRCLLRPLMRWRLPVRWYLVALLLPAAINASALAIHAVGGGAAPPLPGEPAPEQQVAPLVLLPLVFVVFSLAEEIGWRGYALRQLQRRVSALTASLVLGLAWVGWHIPFGMIPDSTQGQIPHGWYLLSTLAISVVFTWLYNSTDGSLLPVVLLHAAVPAAHIVLPVLPSATGDATLYQISSVLYVLAATAIVVAHGPHRLASVHRSPRVGAPAMSR